MRRLDLAYLVDAVADDGLSCALFLEPDRLGSFAYLRRAIRREQTIAGEVRQALDDTVMVCHLDNFAPLINSITLLAHTVCPAEFGWALSAI